jgi:hypothetical protein
MKCITGELPENKNLLKNGIIWREKFQAKQLRCFWQPDAERSNYHYLVENVGSPEQSSFWWPDKGDSGKTIQ